MDLRTDINKTIEYGQKFGVKLSLSQLKKRLFSTQIYDEKEIEKIAKEAGLLKKTSINKQAKIKIAKTKGLIEFLAVNKNILFVGITGSVAYGQPKREDDIDLMIITKLNKLWTTRLWLKVWVMTHKIPHRRYNKKEIGDEFCFNLWLDESALLIPKNKQNLKNGLDLVNTTKILNRKQTWEKFVNKNDWVKKELSTPYSLLVSKNKNWTNNLPETIVKNNFMEGLAYLIQWRIIRFKKRNDLVDFNRAFFHDLVKKK